MLSFSTLKDASPLRQAVISAIIALACMLLSKLFLPNEGFEFAGAFVGIVFFCLMNSVISIFNEHFTKYTLPSYGVFIGLTAILLLTAKLISGISIWQLKEYRMMLTSITLFYFVVSLLVRLIRAIYIFAEES